MIDQEQLKDIPNFLKNKIDLNKFYPIPDYEKSYIINKYGQIISLKRNCFIKPIKYTNDRLIYSLYKNKKIERHSIYQWYSKTFGTISYKRIMQ
jgi:hypothetical protein